MCAVSVIYTCSLHARYMLVLCGHYANNHETIKLAESVILILYVWRHKDAKNHYYHLLNYRILR
jgi:hypothetical protein